MAGEPGFLSYKDVADASGLSGRTRIPPDQSAPGRGLPAVRRQWLAIAVTMVVNQRNIVSGDMTAANRKGFLGAARAAGRRRRYR